MPVPTPVVPTAAPDCHILGLADAKRPHPNKKKIFVFCDGTGNKFVNTNDPKNGNSNVVKLYTTLRVADDQVAYYHPGVGTQGDPNARGKLGRLWSQAKGLAFGAGFQEDVLNAYRYLMEMYNDGDAIYLFGFSRGAYTARALAGMLYGYGLLCRGNEAHLHYAWNMFVDEVETLRDSKLRDRDKQTNPPVKSIKRNMAFAETYSRQVVIRFMGVWDTVSSVGWIYKPIRLVATAQNPIVQVGRHAISIDERRAYYRDNLWGDPVPIDHPEWPEDLRAQNIQQDLAQVWFPGVHSDVGGSYPQRNCGPANVTLEWMIRELQQHGAQLCNDRIDMVLGKPSGTHAADHIYAPPLTPDHRIHDSMRGLWYVLQWLPQQYYSKEDDKIEWRTPYQVPRSIPRYSIIHGSAVRRMDALEAIWEVPYRPTNLVRKFLKPIGRAPIDTTADLTGCYVYEPVPPAAPECEFVRYGKLVAGWLNFIVLWLILGAVAWCLLCVAVLLLMAVLWLVLNTPGIANLLR